MKPFRPCAVRWVALMASLMLAQPARAANHPGDANNDRAVGIDDAALTQSALMGTAASGQLSPFALVTADGLISIGDVMLIGQVAYGVRSEATLAGQAAYVTFSSNLTVQDTYGLQTPFTVLWPIASNFPLVAALVEGIELEYALSSTSYGYLQNSLPFLTSGIARTEFVPLNATGSAAIVSARARSRIASIIDEGYQDFSVRPNCTPSCLGSEFQICSDNISGGSCTNVPSSGNGWTLSTAETSAVDTANRCAAASDCGPAVWRFNVQSPAGTPFAVWVRIRYSVSLAPGYYRFFLWNVPVGGSFSSGYITVTQAFMEDTDCAAGPCAPGCPGQSGDVCWVRLSDENGLVNGQALPTGPVILEAEAISAGGTQNKYFDGYLYTTNLNYIPDEMDTACNSDSQFTAGTCNTPPLNWGPNNFASCPNCGNCALDSGEVCDDGQPGACQGACNETCTGWYNPVCGNGITECGEECDDGILPAMLAPLVEAQEAEAKGPQPFTILPEEEAGPRLLDDLAEWAASQPVTDGEMMTTFPSPPSPARRVIVTLRPDVAIQEAKTFEAQFMAIEARQDSLLGDYLDSEMWEVEKIHAFPVMLAQVSSEGLARLADDWRVLAVEEDQQTRLAMTESLALTGANLVPSVLDHWGTGVGVAVIDSGVYANHDYLAGKVVHEECFCSFKPTPESAPQPCCDNGLEYQSGPGSASDTINGHGTQVAAVIASMGNIRGGCADDLRGVAPRANIIAIRSANPATSSGLDSGKIAALGWVVSNVAVGDEYQVKNPNNIRIVNMSFGGENTHDDQIECETGEPSYRMAVEAGINAGLAVIASSGNHGFLTKLSTPACLNKVISVGDVYDSDSIPDNIGFSGDDGYSCTETVTLADHVSCYSNASPELDILAPGCEIATATIGGTCITTQGVPECGTSLAAAHISGVAALMIGADPNLTQDRILAVLKGTGQTITDVRGGCAPCPTFKRVRAYDAVLAVDRSSPVCQADCRNTCAAGYIDSGGSCDPICGDFRVVDGEVCDVGGICVGGGNPGALCVVGGAAVCTGGGVCQPRPGAGCATDCRSCDASVCGDDAFCPATERCDSGKHCASGSNFNQRCTDVPAICTASGGTCAIGDYVKVCLGGPNVDKPCLADTDCPSGLCVINPGYCSITCQVNQP